MNSCVDYRRALHRIPELDSSLPETTAFVQRILTSLPCKLFSPTRSSVCAFFDAGKRNTVAFRADMDALPLTEETGLSYASIHPGIMHACGHDGHTAMLLALAEYAADHLSELPGNVLLLFQPAEETTGGAKQLCETGILEKYRVRRIFGLHLWPGLPEGTVWSRPGPLMAQCSELTVRIEGKPVHISRWMEGHDALAAGAEFLRRAYSMMDQLPSQEPSILRFGQMNSGTARNAISGQTELLGSLRTYSEPVVTFCRKRLVEIGKSIFEETGCEVSVELSDGFPAVWNHEELYRRVVQQLGELAPRTLEVPTLTAEDFSFYQQCVPGIYFFLGIGNTPELHAPDFAFPDETVLPRGVEFLVHLLHMEIE